MRTGNAVTNNHMYCPYCGSDNIEHTNGPGESEYLTCGDCEFIGNVYEDKQAIEEARKEAKT